MVAITILLSLSKLYSTGNSSLSIIIVPFVSALNYNLIISQL